VTNFYRVGVVSPTKILQANKGNKKYKVRRLVEKRIVENLSIDRMIRHLEM
jgi:hypothetical protein